jgi:hypothetical protein
MDAESKPGFRAIGADKILKYKASPPWDLVMQDSANVVANFVTLWTGGGGKDYHCESDREGDGDRSARMGRRG